MRLRFQVLNSALKGLQFETDADTIRVGRSSRNDLVLRVPSVSRHHATIHVRDGGVVLEDAGSRNETRLDGQVIDGSAELKEGAIIAFSGVMVNVSFPDMAAEAKEDDAEVTPASGVMVDLSGKPAPTGATLPGPTVPESWFQPAGAAGVPAAPGPPPAEAVDRERERRLWPAVTLVLGLAAAVVLIVRFAGPSGATERPQAERGAVLHVTENRLIEVPRGFVFHPEVADDGVVSVNVPLEKLMVAVALAGKSAGTTTVRLHSSDRDRFMLLHVRVLPQRRREVASLLEAQEWPAELKRTRAGESMRRAQVHMEEGALYKAKQELLRALALLWSLDDHAGVRRADEALEEVEDAIDAEYKRVTFEMGQFIKDGDARTAMLRLAEFQRLLPDESDIRRQNVDLLYRLLQRAIERDMKRQRRGL
ncbi:MAG: FHA domain-containing protein [Candidatus Brocadiia bacterium]|jgi:hypothetical protein|nr:FHA domain-containing protein [Candidatus Brocadiia bacterium]